jgi:conjugative relaxase-like TrwC/TraI family protein
VLGIHRVTLEGADYYLNDLAQELPVGPGGSKGRAEWIGVAGRGLGLEPGDPVDGGALRAVLHGRHPSTDRQMRSDRATVGGYDLTFSAPKSASVLFGLGGEEVAQEVLAAHRAAVHGALEYVEGHSLSARRGSGEERQVVPTSGMVAGAFTHGVNRNLDPHLHTHVVVANMVHGEDSRWSACDQRGLWAHKQAAGAVYGSHLRGALSATLGLRWEAGPDGRAEVVGVSPMLLGEFSSRSADIRRHMAAWGSHSARGAQVAWAVTRPPKTPGITLGQLRPAWERRALGVGESSAGVAALVERRGERLGEHRVAGPAQWPAQWSGERPALDEHRFQSSLSTTADGAARRRDVVEGFSVAAINGAPASNVERLTDLWVPPDQQVGVSERVHALRGVVPGSHLTAALGPRPVNADDHAVWQGGAQAIEQYRRQWGISGGGDALGVDRLVSGVASLPAARLVDHLRTSRVLEATRHRLGRREPREMELDRGR